MSLTKGLIQTINGHYGEAGAVWLERVSELIEVCQDRWSLRVLQPFPQLSYHYVTRAVHSDGTQVVLKLGVPHRDFRMQVEALQTFDGCVKLLDADVDLDVVLLESVRPGDMLSDDLDESRAVSVAAGTGEAVVAASASEIWLPGTLWEWSAHPSSMYARSCATSYSLSLSPKASWRAE